MIKLFLTSSQFQISLIDRVHKIYNDTIWQDRSDQEGFKGMGFVIKKIVVHSEPTRVRGGEAHYNMVREKWDVRNLLEVSEWILVRGSVFVYVFFCQGSFAVALRSHVISLFCSTKFKIVQQFACSCF